MVHHTNLTERQSAPLFDLPSSAQLARNSEFISRPGKPTDNGFIEVFTSKLRSECLNAHWSISLADAPEKLEAWRRHYNEDRPHSAIGYNVPIAMHYPDDATSPSP